MSRLNQSLVVSLLLILGLGITPNIYSQPFGYTTRTVISGINIAWEMRWGPDNWIWFTERDGKISRVNPETGDRKILRIQPDVIQAHESGMLGMDFHPHFPDSPYVYVAYTYHDSTIHPVYPPMFIRIVRYTYLPEPDTLTDMKIIYDRLNGRFVHNGTRVCITKDEKMFISVGENYYGEWAQMDSIYNGKILRINIDGSIPEDNPWPGSPVWSKGHRNPQGLCFGPDGTLWSSEHGDSTYDEINIILPKHNYGWPVVEGYCDSAYELQFCKDSNVTEPQWVTGYFTAAVCGLEYYDKDLYPDWQNRLLLATLKDASLWTFKVDTITHELSDVQRIWLWRSGEPPIPPDRIRDVCISPTGRVFISTSKFDVDSNLIFEIIPNNIKTVHNQNRTTNNYTLILNSADSHLLIKGINNTQTTVEIIDILGNTITSRKANSDEIIVSVAGLTTGMYYVRISNPTGVETKKILIR
jgi:glucose/arabinose dehydrogenase